MSKFLCKIIIHRKTHLGLIRNPRVRSLRWFSTSSSDSDDEQSFTVSYLIESVGLSPKQALSASKLVTFTTPEKPDNAIRFLEGYGFTKTQISTLVSRFPVILASNIEKTILPKIEFLEGKGISGFKLAQTLTSFPNLLRVSLENQIIPSFDFLRKMLGSEEKAVATVKRYPCILGPSLKYAVPNMEILRNHRVPESNIAYFMLYHPRSFVVCSSRYRRAVEEVVKLGFDCRQANFTVAVVMFVSIGKATRESKIEAYKKWGLSDEEIWRMFQKNPWCMAISEEKITKSMAFLVEEMGWSPYRIGRNSKVLSFSLKKRTVPRCSVFRFLISKGLRSDKVSLAGLLGIKESEFLRKFVEPYEKKAPEILKLYKEKMSL